MRKIVYKILLEVYKHKKYANLLLKNELKEVSEQDKALITNIVYGTIQNYRLIRYQYEDLLNQKTSTDLKVLLDMSVYQLLWLDKVPSYAIINEAVEIAKVRKQDKFTNAILRKVLARGFIDTKDLSVKYSLPNWLILMIEKQYDKKYLQNFLALVNTQAKIHLRYNSLLTNKTELLKDQRFASGPLDSLEYHGNIINTDYFKKGLVTIQDLSSQEVALFLQPQPNDRILDVCAAPGSKTTHLAMLMANKGEIIALDLYEHRIELLKQQLKKLKITNVSAIRMDALTLSENFELASFDKVLVDAPCSGLGVIRRKPDIKMFIEPKNLDELEILQFNLLQEAAKMLKIDGELVYSTCTINKKENSKLIQKFLNSHCNYQLVKEKEISLSENNDGFYLAKLRKIG
ncbi:MAG: 16S rRNA (cytosine(967)-C(5))-methyltransferase RsmB [Erysipelotrichaceae bacterium]